MSTIPIYNPASPFMGKIIGGLHPGLMIRIKGKVNGYNHRCDINFVHTPSNNHQDVMFHMSIRPNENAIVRNTFQNGKWGPEERDGPCVRANETFEVMISADREFYKLALNGQYLGNYRHRLPLHLVQYVGVNGVCGIDHVLIEQDMTFYQPMPQPIGINIPIAGNQQMRVNQITFGGNQQIGETHYATPAAPARPVYPQGPQMMNVTFPQNFPSRPC